MYVCIYVCVYVCMYERMHTCTYVYKYVCMYVYKLTTESNYCPKDDITRGDVKAVLPFV